MQNHLVHIEAEASRTFHAIKAAQSVDLDIEKKLTHHLEIEFDLDWVTNVAVIYGASGSGKTTLAKKIFGDDCFAVNIDPNVAIIDQFQESFSFDDRANILTSIGLSQVPCWIKPVKTLSNGQQARALAALAMSNCKDVLVLDEWTSVVDRNVAKAMSYCVQKFARKFGKKIILCTCHEDVIEWLKPDVVIDCNLSTVERFSQSDWDAKKKDHIEFDIREVDKRTWKQFSKYHYLSDKMACGLTICYGIFLGSKQIGFQCFAEYTPWKKGKTRILHFNRTVIHPDYCGFGLGIKLINITSRIVVKKGYRVMAKFSSIPVFKSLSKDANWKLLKSDFKTSAIS